MRGSAERMIALQRLLDEVRAAARMLDPESPSYEWRGPARSAFDGARESLRRPLRSAQDALEREHIRSAAAFLGDRVL
jgi:hypothetical protein